MNAVERLLAHGERLLSLFDEMYREPTPSDLGLAEFLGVDTCNLPPSLAREPWVCLYWWQAAAVMACETWDRAHSDELRDWGVSLLRDRLAERQRLLDRNTWQQLVADVVRDCRAWDFLAKKVVRLAQEIADSAIFIEERMDAFSGRFDWSDVRRSLYNRLGFLRRYAQPPAPPSSAPVRAAPAVKQSQARSRKGSGGRPERFTMKFIREVVAARERDQKHAAKARQPLSSFPRWLSDYCSGKGIDIGKMFPPKTPGEAWSKRANRFWKAAKTRLSRAGN